MVSVAQGGILDSRSALGADRAALDGNGNYPWYANGATATTAIEFAVAMGLSTTNALTSPVEFSHALVSFDVAPSSGVTLEVQTYNGSSWVAKIKHYLALTDGVQVVPLGYRFVAGEKARVAIIGGGTTANRSLTLHNVR